jgi:hypothetical protein
MIPPKNVGLFGRKRVSFAHYVGYGNRRYPEGLKNTLLWTSICFFGLGVFSILLVA